MHERKSASFDGRIVIVGFGSIGQGVLPLLLRHLDMPAARITVIAPDADRAGIAVELGVRCLVKALTRNNYRDLLTTEVGKGDLLLNLSVNVSSLALIEFCQVRGALYVDTCIEPWAGGYTDLRQDPSERSNYALREQALALGRKYAGGPTAVLTHGMNPGLVSHFVKQALLDLADACGIAGERPTSRAGWAALAQRLDVKVVHIAERDTQVSRERRQRGEFVNTWSADAFLGESLQPAELGWGSHERVLPADGRRHGYGSDAAIYLQRPGLLTRVRSWTPLEGSYHGFLVTHAESISLADFLTVRDGDTVTYRPTVHYAYHPCDDALLSLHESAGRGTHEVQSRRLMMDDIATGMDELGVLLMGHPRGAYWYGSRLTIGEARRLCPLNNATSLQVTAGVLAGALWAIRHPQCGVVEPEDLDHAFVLDVVLPYMGEMRGEFTEWTPLDGRGVLFPEDVDASDPWQFANFRVT